MSEYNWTVGQRVQVSKKYTGVIRYIGKVPFLEGISAGIELDTDIGENDGTVNNVNYFSCRKNHGYFCPISQIMKEPQLKIVKVYELSIEPKISEDHTLKKSSDEYNVDLDDSLGILDLDTVLGKSSEEDIDSEAILYPLKEFYNKDSYSLGCATHSSTEQEKLNVTEVITSPEMTSLNLSEIIDSSEMQFKSFNLNDAQFDLTDEQWDLNSSHVLNRTFEIENVSSDNLPRIVSPVRKTSSPKRVSTPKLKANYTFNLDDAAEKQPSPIPPLEKTTIKYDVVKGKDVLPKSIYANEDILNVTSIIQQPGDNYELNQTTIFPYSDEPGIISSKTYTTLIPDISDIACNSKDHGGENCKDLNKTFTNFVLNVTVPVDEGKNDFVQKQAGVTGGAIPKSKANFIRPPKKSVCRMSKEEKNADKTSAKMCKLSSRILETSREEQKNVLDKTLNLTVSNNLKKVVKKYPKQHHLAKSQCRMVEKQVHQKDNNSESQRLANFLQPRKIGKKESLESKKITSVPAKRPSSGEMAVHTPAKCKDKNEVPAKRPSSGEMAVHTPAKCKDINEDVAATKPQSRKSLIPLLVTRKKKDKDIIDIIPEKRIKNLR